MHNALFKLAFFLLFFIEGYSLVQSQNKKMSVTDFGAAPFDLTAKNEKYKMTDGDGAAFAIIKVKSIDPNDDLKAYQFNFGYMSHQIVEHDGELWVYVQRNAKTVTINRQGFNAISKFDLGTTIEEGKVYYMTLSPQKAVVQSQWVVFMVTPSEAGANVIVKSTKDGAMEEKLESTDESGATACSLPYGSYTYKVMANGYYPSEGAFTLNDIGITHNEKVTLKPRFSTITFNVDCDDDMNDPIGPATGKRRVFRGGSWGNAGWCSKHNFRGAGKPDKGDDRVGLRLVMDAE